MAWIVDNWMVLVGLAAIVGAVGAAIWRFIRQGKAKQLENVKEWLLYAVTEAERAFGAGTGRLKLRYVYDYFLSTFPWLGKAVSFQSFSDLVDDALASMKEMLQSNEQVKNYVKGTIITEEIQMPFTATSGYIYSPDEDKLKNK